MNRWMAFAFLAQILVANAWSQTQEWPEHIRGYYWKPCDSYYGPVRAEAKIDMVALTYVKWFKPCGTEVLISWERGTLERGATLTKTKRELALSYDFPRTWQKIEAVTDGSFHFDGHHTLIELTPSGETFLRYDVDI